MLFVSFVYLWVTSGNTQGLLLASFSGITPESALETIFKMLGSAPESSTCKANALSVVVLLWLWSNTVFVGGWHT